MNDFRETEHKLGALFTQSGNERIVLAAAEYLASDMHVLVIMTDYLINRL